MVLYHGSNVLVQSPILDPTPKSLDFGAGFYLTSCYDQAKRWAQLKSKRLRAGTPIVSEFEIEEDAFDALSTLSFDSTSEEWLSFISQCRTDLAFHVDYDVVVGPVADDSTIVTIQGFLNGIYSAQEALRRLMPYKLQDQYTFKTENAVSKLRFIRGIYV